MTDETFLRLLDSLIDLAHSTGYYQGRAYSVTHPLTKADLSEYERLNQEAIKNRNECKRILITRFSDLRPS